MEDILRQTTQDLEQTRKKLASCEFDLREAKYDASQASMKAHKLEEEKKHVEIVFQSKITELQLKHDFLIKLHEERYEAINGECNKVCKLLESFVNTAECHGTRDTAASSSSSRTLRHILGKTIGCVERVKIIATNPHTPLQEIKSKPHPAIREVLNVDATVDAAMLEMCKSLKRMQKKQEEQTQQKKKTLWLFSG